jgi:hypothetical protein
MEKLILLLLITIANCSNADAQKKKDTTLEAAVGTFINYPEIAKWLQHDNNIKDDSTLFFVDLNNIIKQPFINTWMGCKISFVNDRLLIDSLKNYQPHYVLKGRPKNFVLIARKKSQETTVIMLLHPFNNMSGEATIIRKGKFYIISKISMGVL